MQFISAMPISRKLPAMIVTLCLTASLSIAVVGYWDFERNIRNETARNFDVVTNSRAQTLSLWVEQLGADVARFGNDPTVVAATTAFNSSYNLMIDNEGLRQAYINDNPNSAGARDLLDQAEGSIPYHFQHGRFHPYFKQIKDTAGYYDFFIFNLNGDLMYSVFKEDDFGTNFATGPYATSGLGEAFERAKAGVAGQVYFADFREYAPSNNAPAGFITTPIVNDTGSSIGVVAVQIPITQIANIVNSPIGLGETGELYLVGPDGLTRTPSRLASGFDVLTDVSSHAQVMDKTTAASAGVVEVMNASGVPVFSQSLSLPIFDVDWKLIGEMAVSEVNAPITATRNKMVLVTLLAAVLSIGVGWMAARSFIVPISRLRHAMEQIADKQYGVTLNEQDRADEIGDLSKGLMAFRDKLKVSDESEEAQRVLQQEQKKIVERMSEALQHLSRGDLTHKITEPFPGDYDQLRTDFNQTVDTLKNTMLTLASRTQEIRSRASKMSTSADDLSRRTESQAATLEQTAAALDEMTASVKSAATGAKEVENLVRSARDDAEQSRPVVRHAVEAMTEISESSDAISRIIGVIDDIAFQTNLLALNAGVEAARAGDAGRGFAVVASEVRALAQRSSEAAKQIKDLIGQSADQVQKGVNQVGQAGDVLMQIAAQIDGIAEVIGEIASGAEEQAIGIGEINIGVTQLDKVTQQNAAMVEEATSSSHALRDDAGRLGELVQRFDVGGTGPNLAAFDLDTQEEAFEAISLEPEGQMISDLGSDRQTLPRMVSNSDDNVWQHF